MRLWRGKKIEIWSGKRDRGTCFCSRGAAMEPTPSKLCFSDVARFEQILNHVLSCSGGRGGSLSAKPASPSLLLSSASFYVNLEETTFFFVTERVSFLFLWLQTHSHTQTVLSHMHFLKNTEHLLRHLLNCHWWYYPQLLLMTKN